MPTVFLNGRIFDGSEIPQVSVFDAAFQHGVGLFETLTGGVSGSGEPWALHLDRHLQRLADSARELGLSADLREGALADAVLETVRRAGLPRARVRLTITGGDLSMLSRGGSAHGGASAALPHDPTVLIVAQRATVYPEALFERGGALVVADARANPLNPLEGHKTVNYWWRLRELQAAAAKGAAEALVLQVSNHLCSGCVSNIFMVQGGALVTPIARGEETGVPSPVLPGVVRGFITEWAGGRGITVHRRMVSIADVLEADELFLTNSSWGVLPVVRVEKERIAGGQVGPLTTDARRAWLDSVGEAM